MIDKLQTILQEIDNGTRKSLYGINFTIEELLSKDDNDISFLENLLKRKIDLDYRVQQIIKNNIYVAYLYSKYDRYLYFFELDERDLLSNIDGQTYLEYFIDNKDLESKMISSFKNNVEVIDILEKKDKLFYLSYLSPEIIDKLVNKNSDGTYIIEKYLNNENIFERLIKFINDPNIILEFSKKSNNVSWLKNVNEYVLMSVIDDNKTFLNYLLNEKKIIPDLLECIPKNIQFVNLLINNNLYDYLIKASESVLTLELSSGQTLLDFLIDNGYADKMSINVWHKETLNILKKKNRLELITDASESLLLKSVKEIFDEEDVLEDVTLLEYMLDNGYNPLINASYISKKEIIEILYRKQRIDLLVKVSGEKLFEKAENHDTYFEYILENVKQNKIKTSIKKLFPYGDNIDAITSYYFTLVKYDMLDYADSLTEEKLLKKYGEITLLEALLNVNSEITLSDILSSSVKAKPSIVALLKSKGFEQQVVNVSSKEEKFADEYLKGVQSTLGVGPLPEEGELLLNKLGQLFLSDGKSDKGLITALVSGYRHSLFVNYQLNIEEIKNLISVKEANMDKFFYIKEEEGAYFSSYDGSVFCDSLVVETLLHETGHALHYYLGENKVFNDYKEVISRVRNNPEVLVKVEEYSNRYNEIRKKISSLVKQKCKDFFELYYNDSKIKEINEILIKSKQEKKEEFIKLGIPEEQLDIILEQMFTEEEYIEHQKRIFIWQSADAIMRSDFGAFMAIGDILDSIYEGKLHCELLKNLNGEKIKGTAGHGIAYYYETIHGFDEMIANFAFISKSKDSVEMLELLKSIVGDELYNNLSEFYYHNIVYSKEQQLDTGFGMGGK